MPAKIPKKTETDKRHDTGNTKASNKKERLMKPLQQSTKTTAKAAKKMPKEMMELKEMKRLTKEAKNGNPPTEAKLRVFSNRVLMACLRQEYYSGCSTTVYHLDYAGEIPILVAIITYFLAMPLFKMTLENENKTAYADVMAN